MAPYEDWNKTEDDDDDQDLVDSSVLEGTRDVILFCIDCSTHMQNTSDEAKEAGRPGSHLLQSLETAMQIQKRKIVVGPNDQVGILLFNTVEYCMYSGTEYKNGTYLFQPIAQVNAPKIQELIRLLHEAKEDPSLLRRAFPPTDKPVPMGDVFTSCNWAIRDGAPKTGYKRVFLITDEDDPHPGPRAAQLATSAKTTLIDLSQAGVVLEPFFISRTGGTFDPTKFYADIFPTPIDADEDEGTLPESISVSRIEDLLAQMRFREMPKRAQFTVPFELYEGFVIGVKGYGLVTEQKKGEYKYFVDLGDRMEVVQSKTSYVDEDEQTDAEKGKILYGMPLTGASADANEDESATRTVPARKKVFFTADEVRSFRTLGLKPGIKLLGFKNSNDIAVEDNTRHSMFIFPDDQVYSGSKRTFSALLQSLIKKDKIGVARVLTRRNASPTICALVPQAEKVDETGWTEPAGFHLITYPFADDLRAAPVEYSCRASDKLAEAATAMIAKLQLKNGTYPPDAHPNPALAYHYAQLEASAFREEFDPGSFEDLTEPKYDMIHKRVGPLMKAWKVALEADASANVVIATAGTKRKADVSVDEAEVRAKHERGQLGKLRVDQLKDFLKSKSQSVSGKKDDLVERAGKWLDAHP